MPELDDIKYVGQGGLNYDDNLQVFPSNDYRYALNCIQDESGEYGVITNVKGNQLVNVTWGYSGVNTVIGYCEDKELRALIWFVYNSKHHHSIVRYKIELNLVEFILHDELILNFDLNHRINNSGIVGSGYRKMLFWTDDYNPPRKLNIAMAKGFTVCSSTSTTSTYTTTTHTTSTTSTTSTSTTSTSTTSTSTITTDLGWCPEFWDIYNVMPDKPSWVVGGIYNEMVEKLIACFVWNRIDIFDFFATHSETTSLINWVNPGVCNPSAVNTPVWTQYQGYIGNPAGLKYIRTNYRPRWEGFHYTVNNASVLEGCATDLEYTTEFGTFDGTNLLRLRSLYLGNVGAGLNQTLTVSTANLSGSSIGYFGATRENTTQVTIWENFIGTVVNRVSSATPTTEVYVCGTNPNGVCEPCPKQLRFIMIGAFLDSNMMKGAIKAIEECLEQLGTGLLSGWPTTSTTSTSSTTTTGYDYRKKF